MSKQEDKKENKLNVELPEEIAQGTYANLAMIAHSNTEFVVDFIRVMPGMPQAKVKSRIILTPEHAKRLLNALKDNIRKYEDHFGTINTPGEGQGGSEGGGMSFPMGFGGQIGEA